VHDAWVGDRCILLKAGSEGELANDGPRTLMVTLLGVPSCGLAALVDVASGWEARMSLLGSGSEASASECGKVEMLGSADMLRYARSPLSRRGRFLVTDESASSIGLREGGLGWPVAVCVGVRGGLTDDGSMTLLLLHKADGSRDWRTAR
jgi:hypothetical protein